MAKVSRNISESLSEYLILTDWIKCKPENVSLKASLGNISLQYPFMTARMQCVVGPEMAVAAGRNGMLTMVPRSLRDEDKQAILDANNNARLRKGDVEFQENPEYAMPKSTLEEVVGKLERTGHSVIPIMDRKSTLEGVYIHNPNNPALVPPNTQITKVMVPLRTNDSKGIPYLVKEENPKKIKEILSKEEKKFLPIVDENMILQKIAFLQRFDTNYIGVTVSTRGKWKEEIERFGAQSDTLLIDSSNACFQDAIKILKYAKKRYPNKPFGVGNIIQGRDFKKFADEGADYIIGGMGVGSICKTGSERGNGRGQFTVAKELANARDKYQTERYVPIVIDGGISNLKDMTIALAFADFVMMGNYFNRFFEAAAQKFDADKKPTSEENMIRYIETWGEGHPRASLVAMYGRDFRRKLTEGNNEKSAGIYERYGHSSISSATVEGVVGLVGYRGRLKPCIENDARYLRTTISNAGAYDLKSFRKNAVVEKASQRTLEDMLPHDIEVTEKN